MAICFLYSNSNKQKTPSIKARQRRKGNKNNPDSNDVANHIITKLDLIKRDSLCDLLFPIQHSTYTWIIICLLGKC